MQNLPVDMNSNKKKVNMYFAALWPELLTKTPVSFVLIHPVLILGLLMLDPLLSPVEIFCWTCLQSHLETSTPTPRKTYLKF